MEKKSKLANLAKKNSAKKTTKGVVKEKKITEKVVEEKKDEILNEKESEIKNKVNKLIEHVDLLKNNIGTGKSNTDENLDESKKNDESPELKKDKTIIWYEEQLNDMYAKYELLQKENEVLKIQQGNGNTSLDSESTNDKKVRETVLVLFEEIQTGYMNLGRNFIIYPKGFLERLIMFFPFLSNYRKF